MRAINTIPKEEYVDRLFQAMSKVRKMMLRIADAEQSEQMRADNAGDEEKALKHCFNHTAIHWATDAITLSPNEIKNRLTKRSKQ